MNFSEVPKSLKSRIVEFDYNGGATMPVIVLRTINDLKMVRKIQFTMDIIGREVDTSGKWDEKEELYSAVMMLGRKEFEIIERISDGTIPEYITEIKSKRLTPVNQLIGELIVARDTLDELLNKEGSEVLANARYHVERKRLDMVNGWLRQVGGFDGVVKN